jgi:hypothetical protein
MAINLAKPGLNPFAAKPSTSWAEFYFNMAVDMLEGTLFQQGTNLVLEGADKIFGLDIANMLGTDKKSIENIVSNAVFAKNLSEEYDKVIKAGFTLFPGPGVAFKGGNQLLMATALLGILNKTKLNKNGDLLRDIGPAIQAYWTGATHSRLPIPNSEPVPTPKFPCIGALQNITTTIAFNFSPGVWTPIIVAPNGEPAPFLLNFIISANLHLLTVGGMYFCNCAYPPPAPPAPGVLPWVSYFTYPIAPTLFTGRSWKDIMKSTGRAGATRITEIGLEVLGATSLALTSEGLIGKGEVSVGAFGERIVSGFTDAGTNPNLTPSQKEGIAAILNPNTIQLGSTG